MTRTALLAAVVSAALLPLSAFAHGGGHGGGGGGGGGHAGGSHASSHPAAHASGHPHPHPPHHAGGSGGSSHSGKSSAVSNAALTTAARPASRPATTHNQFAQNHPRRHEVNHRQREQLARIRQGLKSGKLTPAQAKQLMANDKSIKQQERADVKANGGHLTKAQQKQFNREENANSRLIRADEHPVSTGKPSVATASRPGNPTAAPGSHFAEHHPRREEVNRREADQRARVEQGVRSGKLTPAQAKQLMAKDNSIKQKEHADVKANGGHLTKAEQKQFNQQENANSKLIRADEHPATR